MNDTRATVADIARMKDPADAAYNCAPARFIRAVRAVAPPTSMMKMRSSLGETDFEAQQVLGYAPIEPDGSFKLNVPADTPIALAVVDAQGRALQTHTNWIQVRPGERRTCDGCHSPRRGAPINSGAIVNSVPAGILAVDGQRAPVRRDDGRHARAPRPDAPPCSSADMVSTDIWADTAKAGVTARPAVALRFTGNPNPADDLVTPAPVNGVINYPHAHPAAVDARPRRQHLHVLPQRLRPHRPERHHRRRRPRGVVRPPDDRRPAARLRPAARYLLRRRRADDRAPGRRS